MKKLVYIFISFFLLLLFQNEYFAWLVDSSGTNSFECVDLYNAPSFAGIRNSFQNGKFLDLSQTPISTDSQETWNNQTASFKLKQGCTLQVCSDFYLNGECTLFSKDQSTLSELYHKNVSSIVCNCANGCTESKCSKTQLKENECGRAFIESGCNTCSGEYIGLKAANITYIGAYHDQIKSVIINKGCTITVYEYRDFESELTKVSGGIHDNWAADIGSYECVCDNSTSRTENQSGVTDSGNPILLDVPNTVEAISALIETQGRHSGLLAALRSMKSKRSSRNAYILLLGMTGSGKSATINFLFDNANIAKVGEFKSTTSEITEYRIPVPVGELGLGNSELRVIDTPGLGDTRGMENDAQFLATLDNYLDNHEDLSKRIPNIILVFARFDENRFVGEGSNLAKTLRGLDHFRERLFDNRFSNVIIVLTHAMKAGKKIMKNPKSKLEEFKRAVENYSLFPKPVVVTLAENRPDDEELPIINGYYKLPNGELYPRNLFDRIQEACKNGDDPIGASIISSGFSHPERFNVTNVTSELVGMNYAKVTHYLGLLSAANYKIDETEISTLLAKGYEKLRPDLKKKFPDTLPYLQRTLNIRKITTFEDVPKTSAGIIRLLKDIRQTPAVIALLEESLNMRVPTLEINLLAGQGYDIIKDVSLATSPFKSRSVAISDIGYMLPDTLTCVVQNEITNIFQTFGSKTAYYQARLRSLNVEDADVTSDAFEFELKPGFNLLESERNTSSSNGLSLTAVREQRLFQLTLNDKAELNPDFVTRINNLPIFNETDYANVADWTNFFTQYGTHVIKAAHGGGAIEINLKADKDAANSSNITEELGETLFRLVQFAEDVYIGKRSHFNMAQTGITHSLAFRGGDYQFHTTDLFRHGISGAANLLTSWEESLILQPTMLQSSMNLLPISEVVKRISEEKAIEIATAAKSLYNATLKYIPPPPPPPPPKRNETWIADIVNSYNIQISKIMEEFQEERKENAKQIMMLHENFRTENERRDNQTRQLMEVAAKAQEEQIKTIREENERREAENQRRHDERVRIANAQIVEIQKENVRRSEESKRDHDARVEQANQQIELIRAENERRAQADKDAYALAQKTSQAQIDALMHQINNPPKKKGKCLKAGTKITMADGSEMPVEKVKRGDFVLDKDLNPTLVTSVASWFKQKSRFFGFDTETQFFTETHAFVGNNGKIFVADKDELIHSSPLMEYVDIGEMRGDFEILKKVSRTTVTPVPVQLFEDPNNAYYTEDILVYFLQVESASGTYIANSYVCRHEIPDFTIWPNTIATLFTIVGLPEAEEILELDYTLENDKMLENLGAEISEELNIILLEVNNILFSENNRFLDGSINELESNDTKAIGKFEEEMFDEISEIFQSPQMSIFAVSLYAHSSKPLSKFFDNPDSNISEEEIKYWQNILINSARDLLEKNLNQIRWKSL